MGLSYFSTGFRKHRSFSFFGKLHPFSSKRCNLSQIEAPKPQNVATCLKLGLRNLKTLQLVSSWGPEPLKRCNLSQVEAPKPQNVATCLKLRLRTLKTLQLVSKWGSEKGGQNIAVCFDQVFVSLVGPFFGGQIYCRLFISLYFSILYILRLVAISYFSTEFRKHRSFSFFGKLSCFVLGGCLSPFFGPNLGSNQNLTS